MRKGDDELKGLIREAAINDSTAMGKLYEKSLPIMMSFARQKLKTSPYLNCDPEDLVQEAWRKVSPYIASIADEPDSTARFVSLVTKTINNLLIDAIRRKETNLRRLESDILNDKPDDGLSPSRHYAAQQAFCFLGEAIKKLDPQQQDIIRYRYDLDMTFAKIASLLNAENPTQKLTADAIRGRLNPIHVKLKEEMGASSLYFLPKSKRDSQQ